MTKKVPAILIIIFISLSMLISVLHRPTSYVSNEIAQCDELSLNGNVLLMQELDIFHDDRDIKEIYIKFDGELEATDLINIVISTEHAEVTKSITEADIDEDGWYKLVYNFDSNEEKATLKISSKVLKGNIALCLSQDIDNLGCLSVNGEIQDYVLTSRVVCTIKNSVWDSSYKWLILLYMSAALAIVLIINEKEDKKGNRFLFGAAIALNVLGVYIFVPYIFQCPQIAENVITYYYETKKCGILEQLFMQDAGYLPLCQRLISIVYVKFLGLGVNSLYFMQATGVIFDAMMGAMICLYTYRNLGPRSIRFAISLMVLALFANSTVSTFFDFIYLGYFFILLILVGSIEELKKWQFVVLCSISMIICLSKGFYVVFLPFGIIALLLCKDILKHREKEYILCLTIASGLQLLYAFLNGGINKWLALGENIYVIGIAVGIGLVFVLICFLFLIPKMREYINKSLFLQSIIKPIMLSILMIESFLLTFIVFHAYMSFPFIMNWGYAWIIPCSLAFIVLVCLLGWNNSTHRFVKCISYTILLCYCVMAFKYSTDKCNINYNCVEWSVYKNHFDYTIVPIFKYDTRFGTMADGLTLYYSDSQPAHEYEYGVPYSFDKIDIDNNEDVVRAFNMPEEIESDLINAIYLNYPSDIGNSRIYLELLNADGEVIENISQITPLSSKTIGFIFEEEVKDVSSINVKTADGKDGFVENSIIVVQSK